MNGEQSGKVQIVTVKQIWVFRANVTADSGIVTDRPGHAIGALVYAVGTVLRMNQPGGPVASLHLCTDTTDMRGKRGPCREAPEYLFKETVGVSSGFNSYS